MNGQSPWSCGDNALKAFEDAKAAKEAAALKKAEKPESLKKELDGLSLKAEEKIAKEIDVKK